MPVNEFPERPNWVMHSEQVRGEPRFYWVEGLSEEEARLAEAHKIKLYGERRAVVVKRGERLIRLGGQSGE